MKTIVEYLINNHVSSKNAMIDSLYDGDFFVVDYDGGGTYDPAKVMGKFKNWKLCDKEKSVIDTYFQINMGTKGVAGVYQNYTCTFYNKNNPKFGIREPYNEELAILKEIDNEITITDGGKIIGEFDYNTNKFSQVF